MNKLDTIAYYEALNAGNRLITIDSTDSKSDVKHKIENKTNYNMESGTIHIEVFHNDECIISYSLIKTEDKYDLWSKKQRQVSKSDIDGIVNHVYDNLPEPIKSPYDKYIASRKDEYTYIVKSFCDDDFEMELDTKNITIEQMSDTILGKFVLGDGSLDYHPINNADTSKLEELTSYIKDEKIRLFANTCLKVIPDYVFEIPAGISGKHNSASDLYDGGLYRHIQNAVKLLLVMTSADYARIKFTQHEIDMMIVAVLFSDVLKHGWQEDYENDKVPKPDHPRLAANFIRSMTDIITASEMNFIANCIESHMGQFGNKPEYELEIPLPVPDTEYKYTVYLADYIASLKDISFVTDNTLYAFDSQKVVTLDVFKIASDHDIEILSNVLDSPINMTIANELGIYDTVKEIKDVWSTIIDTKKASFEQSKYIELAKRLAFE